MTDIQAGPGWARANAFVDVGRPIGELTQVEIMDRFLIQDTIHRYGWSYDERDVEALSRAFAPDAVYEGFVAGVGGFGPYVGRDAILAWFTEYMTETHVLRRHRVTNATFIAQNKESARVNAYLELVEVRGGATSIATSGFYRLDLKKFEGVWVFSHVFAGFDSPF
jgi:hypothetical protein